MELIDVSIERYRSIKDQTGEDSIELEGLDCLVGKNNCGKTNTLCAILFLLGEAQKDHNEELFWNKDTEDPVEVRAFFDVSESDLERVQDHDAREAIRDCLLDERGFDGVLGIARRAVDDDGIQTSTHLLQYLPVDEHYQEDTFIETRDEYWKKQKEGSLSKTEYRDQMTEEYPDIAEHIPSDKRRNKGSWETGYAKFVESRPGDLELSLQCTDFVDGTKGTIFDQLLPRIISIPAVKEIESTTKRGGEFGDLIDQVSAEVEEDLDGEIESKLDGFDPGTHPSIQRVERRLSEHLGETFDGQSVEFEFPTFSSKYLFRNADLRIQEEKLDDLSKENVGEGVKRTLIFSLIRTIADIREGEIAIADEEEPASKSRPLLILFEEAELFLHPALQKTLLQTFEQLTSSNAQVVFSTHSPILLQHDTLDTINIVREEADGATTVTQFHRVLEKRDPADRSRLTDLQSVSSYIFSDRVVLVEGLSDQIVLKKLARALDPEWDFTSTNVALLPAGGKGNVCRFYRFLEELGIETFAVFDIDAMDGQCQDIVSDQPTKEALERFETAVEDLAPEPGYSSQELDTRIRQLPWDDAFERLEELKETIESGTQPSTDDAQLLHKLLQKCAVSDPPKRVWTSDDVAVERRYAVERLLDHGILLLSGEIEDYYPCDGGNKREAALAFDPNEYSSADLRERFEVISYEEETDVELLLHRIFDGAESETVADPVPM